MELLLGQSVAGAIINVVCSLPICFSSITRRTGDVQDKPDSLGYPAPQHNDHRLAVIYQILPFYCAGNGAYQVVRERRDIKVACESKCAPQCVPLRAAFVSEAGTRQMQGPLVTHKAGVSASDSLVKQHLSHVQSI